MPEIKITITDEDGVYTAGIAVTDKELTCDPPVIVEQHIRSLALWAVVQFQKKRKKAGPR